MPEVADTCSLASPASVCRTQHLHLRCSVDFARRTLTGTAALTVQSQEDNLRSLTLDTKDLTIEKVVINGQEVKYTLGERQGYKGSPMEISLPIALSKNQEVVIEISYETSPKSSALQWLTPEQTSGKQHPYLFSQCQAIHCRAVLPCQDTPSVKLTYTAEVSVPKELVALMSAIRDGEAPDPEDPSRKIYRFNQRVPIPCYLIALVVGALESRQIGPRTLVWSEKEQVEKSAYEFSETESMLQIAEDLGGPYVWGQYDLLVLPPSFPYGGMENPCLTFVTPTLLAGDKSLSNVIAHEISHSWTGNLVTNKTWDHFWLNEGHTVYLERHICGRLFGEKFRHFHALGGWGELQNTIKTFGESHPFTKLVVDLKDVDPDVAYSSIPYEKGFALLFYLEQLLGGPEVFLGFLKAYVENFSYKSVTTDDWKAFLYSHFKDKVDLLNQVDWNAWLYSPGLPPVKPNYDMTLTNACIALSQRWVTAKEEDLNSFSIEDLKDLSSHQLNEFLAQVLQKAPLPLGHIKRMQEVYNFNAINNSEIRFRWLRLCIQSKWEEAIPLALKMATEQGRMKFTRPLFRDLAAFDKSHDQAVRAYQEHKASMHPVTAMLRPFDGVISILEVRKLKPQRSQINHRAGIYSRYTVHVRGEWLAVPCQDGKLTVGWLGREAVRRYMKNKPDNGGFASVDEVRFLVRRCKGLGLLDNEDLLEVALEDNEFVEVVIEGDVMSPDFIPSQPEGVFLYSKYREPERFIDLDGDNLSTEDLVNLGKGHYKIKLTPNAEKKVQQSREVIDRIIKEKKVVYGITTGFGKFARTVIPNNKLQELQVNLVRSHSSGVGKPLSPERCRMLLALRINVLAKGYSGISLETLKQVIEIFNASCLSYVPEKGTVGASGDLAPLSHLALGLIGEGKMWSPKSGWADAKYVLEAHGLKPVVLKPKEGLALINGTQMITSLGCEAVERAIAIARQADIVAALTLEVLKGTTKAFDTDIHAVRPHRGQIEVAFRFRSLLDSDHHPSEIAESHRFCDRVQDAYTLRCCPQVHGVVNDTIAFVKDIITTELNSATDNPMVFASRGETISGGNFHGEYPAKALDYLAIGVHELAAISERRIERLCNPSLSELPAFLVSEGGLNSGFMIAHCTAAALVSESKALCHPSSVDSLSTSAATEDHVSMGGWASRKALRVVEHVEQVLAIELLAACQGIEFLRPLKTTTPLEKVYDLVRSVVRPWIKDRFMAPDIEAAHRLLLEQKVWEVASPYIEKYRMEHIPESRPLSPTAFSLGSLQENSATIPESDDL